MAIISIMAVLFAGVGALALYYTVATAQNWHQSFVREVERLHALDLLDGGHREERFVSALRKDVERL